MVLLSSVTASVDAQQQWTLSSERAILHELDRYEWRWNESRILIEAKNTTLHEAFAHLTSYAGLEFTIEGDSPLMPAVSLSGNPYTLLKGLAYENGLFVTLHDNTLRARRLDTDKYDQSTHFLPPTIPSKDLEEVGVILDTVAGVLGMDVNDPIANAEGQVIGYGPSPKYGKMEWINFRSIVYNPESRRFTIVATEQGHAWVSEILSNWTYPRDNWKLTISHGALPKKPNSTLWETSLKKGHQDLDSLRAWVDKSPYSVVYDPSLSEEIEFTSSNIFNARPAGTTAERAEISGWIEKDNSKRYLLHLKVVVDQQPFYAKIPFRPKAGVRFGFDHPDLPPLASISSQPLELRDWKTHFEEARETAMKAACLQK